MTAKSCMVVCNLTASHFPIRTGNSVSHVHLETISFAAVAASCHCCFLNFISVTYLLAELGEHVANLNTRGKFFKF